MKAQPFQITPDPDFLYRSVDNRGTENVIQFSISQLAPLTVVTGEVGIGKTCLIRKFLNDAPDDLTIGLISNYTNGNDDLDSWVLNAFDQPLVSPGIDGYRAIETFLLAEFDAGRRCVLLIDEAQALRDDDLEQLRMLSNINDGRETLLMLFLVGQPELRARLRLPGNRQFAQRITTMAHLEPMTARDSGQYVRHRLRVAGANYDVFDEKALQMVHEIASGVPRVINVVCNLVMFEAFGDGATEINGEKMARYLGEAEQNGYLAHLSDIRLKTAAGPGLAPASSAPISIGTGSHRWRVVGHAPGLRLVPKTKPEAPDAAPKLAVKAAPVPITTPTVQQPKEEPARKPAAEKPKPLVLREPTPVARHAKPPAKDRLPPLVLSPRDPEPAKAIPASSPPRKAAPAVQKRGGMVPWTLLAASVAAGGVYFAVTQIPPGTVDLVALTQPQIPEKLTVTEADIVTKAAAIPLSFTPDVIAPLPDPGGEALIAKGLELGATDPVAAAIAYARAALRGEKRAAYFLAQMYETGDGVPYDPAMARAWYTLFPEPSRSVERRLAQLTDKPIATALTAPVPMLGGPIQNSAGAEFVWTGLSGSDKVQYVIELADSPDAPAQMVAETAVSAAMIDELGDLAAAKLWRVVAVDTETGAQAASDWQPMGAGGN